MLYHSIGQTFGCTVFTIRADSQGFGEGAARQRGDVGGALLAQEALVSHVTLVTGRSVAETSSSGGSPVAAGVPTVSSECSDRTTFCLASFRRQGEEAGLSERAAELSAGSLRESSRQTYDSRLAHFRKWCAEVPCCPTKASLRLVTDF